MCVCINEQKENNNHHPTIVTTTTRIINIHCHLGNCKTSTITAIIMNLFVVYYEKKGRGRDRERETTTYCTYTQRV